MGTDPGHVFTPRLNHLQASAGSPQDIMASFADLIPTVSWAPLEDQNYSKLEVYEMQWLADAVRLENVLIVGAPYGGPIGT